MSMLNKFEYNRQREGTILIPHIERSKGKKGTGSSSIIIWTS